MAEIVFTEHRSFSYLDFVPKFEVEGKAYRIAVGTFRNKVHDFVANGDIELEYRSKQAFYTMMGCRFERMSAMTRNPVGDKMVGDPIYKWIVGLPTQRQALHNIRLKFKVKGIWSTISSLKSTTGNAVSKDIALDPYQFRDLEVNVIIHHKDTVTVYVACSYNPIVVDISGIIRLSNALTRVEERLSSIVKMTLPEHGEWIITMWHFGVDSLTRMNGRDFSVTYEEGIGSLIRVYVKRMKRGDKVLRLERQEYPKKNFIDAINEKLS